MDKEDSTRNRNGKVYNEISLFVIKDCDRCKDLETKLLTKDIKFDLFEITVDNVSFFMSKGFKIAPILVIDGEMLNYEDALKWVSDF